VPDNPGPASGPAPTPTGDAAEPADAESFPHWFTQFLNDRQTRKPSAHTMKAYRQDFAAIAFLVTEGKPARLTVADITKDAMRHAFAAYARDHEAASIRRCWSTWNVLCTFLYTGEQLAANPMQLVGRPKLAKPLPKALPRTAVEALLEAVAHDQDSNRQTDWTERDLALILTGLLAGLRAEELRQANVGDIRTTDDGAAVIHVKRKGGKDRSVPIEAELLSVIDGIPPQPRNPLPRHG
jgi:integrase/recombinase XerC